MNWFSEHDLFPYNTFRIHERAKWLVEIQTIDELSEVLQDPRTHQYPLRILGGGSNILLTQYIAAVVMKQAMLGKQIVDETDEYVDIEVMGGEPWHPFVRWCIEQGWGGIENLSLIPGTAGAAPIQNIGAYGVELKDCFLSLKAIDLQTKQIHILDNQTCAFGYRQSVFKRNPSLQYFIVSMILRLRKKPVLQTSYGQVAQELIDMGKQEPGIQDVSDAIIRIRQRKLPDPALLGNAGSFFKNPQISFSQFSTLQSNYPEIPYWKSGEEIKVPAAWLIEHAQTHRASGWKGFKSGACGVHPHQALCLVNYGEARGDEILQLSEDIVQSVFQSFNILLEREVNIW